MGHIINIALFISLIKLINTTESPLLCAGIYTGFSLLIDLILKYNYTPVELVITAIVCFLVLYLYFWLFLRYAYTTTRWVIFIIIGAILII